MSWKKATLKIFFSNLPSALFEAATIDGASQYRQFLTVGTPIIVPGITVVLFYSVLFYWNDPFHSLLYTDNYVPVATYLTRIYQYIEYLKWLEDHGGGNMDFTQMQIPEKTVSYAIAVVTAGPMLFIILYFQKYFIKGLASGSVKE